jgi:ATP-dependent DNA ligase
MIKVGSPMEARSAPALPDGEGWWFEPKWDGFRCLVFKDGGEVRLQAKSGRPLGRYFPEILAAVADFTADRFVIDGELLIQAGGAFSFEALQMRLHPAASRVTRLARETPAGLTAFDMLYSQSGQDLRPRPLSERREALEALLASPQAWLDEGKLEGIIAKRLDGPYLEGVRAMVKVKRIRTADCVVGGFRYASAGGVVGSLLLGLYDEKGRLNHVGFTSGLAGIDKADLTGRLEALAGGEGFTGDRPGGPSRWSTERTGEWTPLRPELVVEVSFDHVSGGRFRHGTRLIRFRPDKAPEQCRMEQIL